MKNKKLIRHVPIKRQEKRQLTVNRRMAAVVILMLALSPAGQVMAGPPAPDALPSGGQITAGAGRISQTGNAMTVNQYSERMIANWQGFTIGQDASVNFRQPGFSSVALNRVVGQDPSQIFGRLTSNGQVFLVNPAGIIFGPSARVDVGGIVASTLSISDQDFWAGTHRFNGLGGPGKILNQGSITAAPGSVVAFIAPEIRNEGSIAAPGGTVALAAGDTVHLDFAGDGLINVAVSQSTLNGLIENKGAIKAAGGTVILSARAAGELMTSVVNNEGVIEAKGIVEKGGRVLLEGDLVTNSGVIDASSPTGAAGDIRLEATRLLTNSGQINADGGNVLLSTESGAGGAETVIENTGTIRARTASGQSGVIKLLGGDGSLRVGGTLDASAPNGGDGGFIETSAAKVNVADDARITTEAANGKVGVWLIDPFDFTVAASGGNITGTALGNQLGSNSVTIHTDTAGTDTTTDKYGISGSLGDIFVNDSITWSANNLTLKAYRNIEINRELFGSGTATLSLLYGQGTSDGVIDGTTASYSIKAPVNLPAGDNFSTMLGSLGTTRNFKVITSLGSESDATAGTNQTLQGMARTANLAGNYALGANIDASGTSTWNGGAGFAPIGVSTEFAGKFDGLGHTITALSIDRPSEDYVGLFGNTKAADIRDVGLVNSVVRGHSHVGGLAGESYDSVIKNASSTGTISSATLSGSRGEFIGGLVGHNDHFGDISNSYAAGTVGTSTAEGKYVGGLVGENNGNGTISNSYSTAEVTGYDNVGGLVGHNQTGSTAITNSYSAGAVVGTYNKGGLLGVLTGSGASIVIDSFWDKDTAGTTLSAAGVAKTTAEMKTLSTFNTWDIDDPGSSGQIWRIYNGNSYPLLRSFLTPLTLTANSASKTYDKASYSGGASYTASSSYTSSYVLGTASYGGTSQGAVNAGSYTLTLGGLYSSQQGYDLSLASGTLTINAKAVTLTAPSVTKTYDGTTAYTIQAADLTALGGSLVGGDTVSAATISYGTKHAGSGNKSVTLGSATISDGNSGNNYSVTLAGNSTSTINKANLTLSTSDVTKTYDGGTTASGTAVVTSGSLFGTDSVSGGTFAFTNKNAGTNKTVTTTGVTVSDGNSGGNYNVSYADNTASIINAKAVTLTAPSVTKTYDGTTAYTTQAADLTALGGSLVGGDTVSAATISYGTKHAGSGNKAVTLGSATISDGNSGNNYSVTLAGNSTSTINKADLTLSTSDVTRTYDGGTTASGTAVVTSGSLFGTDSVSGGTFAFTNKNAGTNKTVTTTGVTVSDGNSGGNYNVSYADSMASIINAKAVTLTAPSVTKTYDGTTAYTTQAADLTALGGSLVGGDTVSAATISYGTKHAGSGNKAVTLGSATISDGNSGNNYSVTLAGNSTSTINKADLTLSTSDVTRTYNGGTTASGTAVVTSGSLFGTDSVSGGTFAFTNKNAGTNKTVTTTGVTVSDGNSGGNYNVSYADNTASIINAKAVTLTAPSVTKTYDGTTAYTTQAADLTALGGSLVGGDTVSAATISYGTKHAGSGNKAVTLGSATISDGNSGNNYSVTLAGNSTSTINKADLTLSTSDVTRTYDGGTTASGTAVVTSGSLFGTDSVSGGTFAFTNKNAGTNKTVTTTGVTVSDGNSGGNYNVSYADNTASIINAKAVTLTAPSVTKTYDGTTAYTTQAADLTALGGSLVGGDTVSAATISYGTKHAGSGNKAVTLGSATISDGNSGNNYSVTLAGNSTSTINKANLTLSTSDVTRTYDGGTTASGTAVVTSGSLFGTDSVSGGTFAFTNKNAGTNKTVTTTGVTVSDGNSGGNYNVSYADNMASIINAKAVTLTAPSVTKTYDGTTAYTTQAADLTALGGSLVVGDTVSAATISYGTKHAGSGNKAVTLGSATISDGNSGNNYSVTLAGNSTSTINKANLTLSTSDVTRTYDGGTTASGTAVVTSGSLFGTDSVSGGTFAFTNKNAGTNKTVTTTGVTVSDGNSGGNYNVSYADNMASIINAKAVTLTAPSVTKTYDGTTAYTTQAADLTALGGSLVGGDTVSAATISYGTKHAGSGNKAVTLGSATISDGNSGSNYSVTLAGNSTSTINKAPLTITAQTNTKVYDGSTVAAAVPTVSGLQSGDLVTGLTEVYDTKHAGTGKTLSVSTYTIDDGNGGNNYAVTAVNDTTGIITQRPLSLSYTGVNKVYDGTTLATVNLSDNRVSGDNLTIAPTAAFDDKNAGTGKTMNVTGVSLSGSDAENYTVSATGSTTADITKAPLTITAQTNTKVYDGSTTADAIPTVSGLQSGDLVTGLSEVYDTKNAGTGKTLSVSAYAISDGNSGNNYAVTTINDATGVITQRPLAVAYAGESKVYDGTTSATVLAMDDRVAGDDLTLNWSAAFFNKNVGTSKGVSVTDVVLSGADGENYSVPAEGFAVASITKAPLTISAAPNTKIYDGTPFAGAKPTVDGLQSGDTVTGLAEKYDNWLPGTGKTLSVSGYAIKDGNGGKNYEITTVENQTGVITPPERYGDRHRLAVESVSAGFLGADSGSQSILFQSGQLSANLPLSQWGMTPAVLVAPRMIPESTESITMTGGISMGSGEVVLPVYTVASGSSQPVGQFFIGGQETALTMSSSAGTMPPEPIEAAIVGETTSIVTLQDGTRVWIGLSLDQQGMLMVSVPAAVLESLGVTGVVLDALAAAGGHLVNSVADIKGVRIAAK